MNGQTHGQNIASIIARLRAGVSPDCDPVSPGPGEFGVLTVGAVTSGKVIRQHAKRIDAARVKAEWPVVQKGTILVSRANGSRDLVGACVLVEEDDARLILPDKLWALEVAAGRSARFLIEFLRSARGRKAIHAITRGSSGMWNIPQEAFLALQLPRTTERLEAAVSAIAEAFDDMLDLLTAMSDAKRRFKRGVMQQLLTGHKRFPEFGSRPWTFHRFDTLCEELSDRNGNQIGADHLMGVIKGVGFEPMRDRVRGKGDLARYKIVPPGAFAYNPMRLNIGSIAFNELGRSILVSPDYVVFRVRSDVADPEFINQLRYSSYWTSFMKRAGAGSVRVRIYFGDLARLRVPAPALDEQKRVARIFRLLDSEIDQFARLRKSIESQKDAILSRLLNDELSISRP